LNDPELLRSLRPRAAPQKRRASFWDPQALDATEVLVGGRLHGLQTNHAYTVPKTYLDQLAPPQRAVLAGVFGDSDE
jgi:hypothetical protein